jgi:hypothetical protein
LTMQERTHDLGEMIRTSLDNVIAVPIITPRFKEGLDR